MPTSDARIWQGTHFCPWISISVSERVRSWIELDDVYSSSGFPGGSKVKNLSANAGDVCLIPWSRRSPGEGNGNPLQYSLMGNPMDRGACRDTVHGVPKGRTWLSAKNNNKNNDSSFSAPQLITTAFRNVLSPHSHCSLFHLPKELITFEVCLLRFRKMKVPPMGV